MQRLGMINSSKKRGFRGQGQQEEAKVGFERGGTVTVAICQRRDEFCGICQKVKENKKRKMSKTEYQETNGIPVCPHCKKPTERVGNVGMKTCMYFPPVYDKNGVNTNPDRNTITSTWHCNECGKDYKTAGNYTDGFDYA